MLLLLEEIVDSLSVISSREWSEIFVEDDLSDTF